MDRDDEHAHRMVLETNFVAIAVVVLNTIIDGPVYYFCACLAVTLFLAAFTNWQVRIAKRRYEQGPIEHMMHGGTVILTKHGRHWRADPLFPDLSKWEGIQRREGS
jgi:hypothetical protein